MLRFMVRILGMHGRQHIVAEQRKIIGLQIGGL